MKRAASPAPSKTAGSFLSNAPPDTIKRRRIHFQSQPPGQRERAALLLAQLAGLRVQNDSNTLALIVEYRLNEHTLKGLESALTTQGLRLTDSTFTKLVHALIYFCENTQLHNMRCPQRLIKQSHEIYVKAWEGHLHGDHDDTPIDLREYK